MPKTPKPDDKTPPQPLTPQELVFQSFLLKADANHDRVLSAKEQIDFLNLVPDTDEAIIHLFFNSKKPATFTGPNGQAIGLMVMPGQLPQFNALLFNAESYEGIGFTQFGITPAAAKAVIDANLTSIAEVRRSDVIDQSKQFKETSPSRNLLIISPRTELDEVLPPPPPRQPDRFQRGRNAPLPNGT